MTLLHDPVSVDPRLSGAVRVVHDRSSERPAVGVVLGSGLGGFAEALGGNQPIDYRDLPGMPRARVAGHAGELRIGKLGDASVACLCGRAHLYEGHSPKDVVLGVRLLAALGCETVILTNAAGGIREDLQPGRLMLLTDHINLTGDNPLTGLAAAFVDLTRAYDAGVAAAATSAAAAAGIDLAEGVYAGLRGPSYETPAEIRMLRVVGADAVGMSTVHEVIALRHLGVRVGAVSCITNRAAGVGPGKLSHEEVAAVGHRAREPFEALLSAWIDLLARGNGAS